MIEDTFSLICIIGIAIGVIGLFLGLYGKYLSDNDKRGKRAKCVECDGYIHI